MATDLSRPMEILGITSDNQIAFRFGDAEVLTLGESALIELMGAISRDYLPLWPQSPCAACGRDAVVTIEGRDLCEGDAMGFGMAEADSEGER